MEFWWIFRIIYMEFPCSFHLVNLFGFADAGTCKEPPWNLHGTSMETPSKLHSSTRLAQKSWARKETCWDCFCWKLHQTSIKTPWNLHGNSIKTTFEYKMAQKSRAKKETCWDCFCWKLHQTSIKNSMESPWNLHESDHWNQQGKSARNLHQNSMEPTSILTKMTTKALQKRSLKLLALFCHKVNLKRKKS